MRLLLLAVYLLAPAKADREDLVEGDLFDGLLTRLQLLRSGCVRNAEGLREAIGSAGSDPRYPATVLVCGKSNIAC